MKGIARLTLGLGLLAFVQVATAAESDWRLELAPYVWGAGIDGTVTAAGRSASFDVSFSDLFSSIDAAFMGMGVVRYKHFVVFGQYDYVKLTDNGNVKSDAGPLPLPPGTKVNGELDMTIGTGGVGWQFDIFDKHQVDLLVGIRKFNLDTELQVPGNKVSTNDDITDTIVIVSPSLHFGEKWTLKPIISYGIAGDSDTTYELQPQLHYQLRPDFTLGVGYRRLHYEEKSGQGGTPSRREFDGDLEGFMLGFAWGIGGRQ